MTTVTTGARTGGALAVETLVSAGVEVVFGLHGAHVEAIFQSCVDAGVRIVDTRHEAAAGHAAEGYARVGRRLGVAIATAGPGFTNIVTSMANAAVDRTPVLYVIGAAPLDYPESNCLQSGIDQLAVAAPIVKWAHRVARTADVARLVAQAIRVATAAPTGPVYLEIPINVMNGTAEVPAFPAQRMAQPAPASVESIRQILQVLGEAARPLILAGGPVYHGGGEGALVGLAERLGIPVFADFEALGALPCSHPCSVARSGNCHASNRGTSPTSSLRSGCGSAGMRRASGRCCNRASFTSRSTLPRSADSVPSSWALSQIRPRRLLRFARLPMTRGSIAASG